MAIGKRRRFSVFKRDGFKCRYCGSSSAASELRVDHVFPVSLGGSDRDENLITACHPCNAGKTNAPFYEVELTNAFPLELIELQRRTEFVYSYWLELLGCVHPSTQDEEIRARETIDAWMFSARDHVECIRLAVRLSVGLSFSDATSVLRRETSSFALRQYALIGANNRLPSPIGKWTEAHDLILASSSAGTM